MRDRLEPLRGLWLLAGSLLGWACAALPSGFAWASPAVFLAFASIPRTRGTRAALAAGAILQVLAMACLWQPPPTKLPVRGRFAVEILRETRPGRVLGVVRAAPPGLAAGSVVGIRLDSAAVGDLLVGAGEFLPPRPPSNPGGFDEERWSASSGLAGTLRFRTTRDAGHRIDRIEEARERLRGAIRATLAGRLDPSSADLWIATILAEGSRLPVEVGKAFRRTGLTHMLSVSGFHLVVLGGAVMVLLSLFRTGPIVAATCAMAVVWAYVGFLGCPAPALRAAIAFSGFVLARWTGRKAHAGNVLGLAGAVLVILDPNAPFQVGVQLSFAATAALVWVSPALSALLSPSNPPKAIRWILEGLCASLAATLATAPTLAWSMGQVPWIGIPAGLVASGFFSLGFLSSLGVLALSLLPAPWSIGFAGASELCSRAVLEIALRAGAWDGGWFEVSRPRVVSILAWFAMLVSLAACRRAGRARRLALASLPLWLAAIAWSPALEPARRTLEVFFLDVGQGDATLVSSPNGDSWLVDGGPRTFGANPRDAGTDVVVPALHALRIDRLRGIAVTHADLDHWGGVPSVAARIPVEVLLEPSARSDEPAEAWERERSHLLSKGIASATMGFGERIALGSSGSLVCMAPARGARIPERNAGSLVLSLRWGRARVLLTGDADLWTEGLLLADHADLRADVLKVGHHGSRHSTGDAFLESVSPRWAVLSCGTTNRYGHPHREIVERLDRAGCTILDTRRGGWKVSLHEDGRIEAGPAVARWWRGPWVHRLSFR